MCYDGLCAMMGVLLSSLEHHFYLLPSHACPLSPVVRKSDPLVATSILHRATLLPLDS